MDEWTTVIIPPGTYKADDLHVYIKDVMKKIEEYWNIPGDPLEIDLNNNTLRTHLGCTYDIRFGDKSVGPLLRFTQKELKKTKWHISNEIVKIVGSNALSVNCKIVGGSYKNGRQSHILHQFYPDVPQALNSFPNRNR